MQKENKCSLCGQYGTNNINCPLNPKETSNPHLLGFKGMAELTADTIYSRPKPKPKFKPKPKSISKMKAKALSKNPVVSEPTVIEPTVIDMPDVPFDIMLDYLDDYSLMRLYVAVDRYNKDRIVSYVWRRRGLIRELLENAQVINDNFVYLQYISSKANLSYIRYNKVASEIPNGFAQFRFNTLEQQMKKIERFDEKIPSDRVEFYKAVAYKIFNNAVQRLSYLEPIYIVNHKMKIVFYLQSMLERYLIESPFDIFHYIETFDLDRELAENGYKFRNYNELPDDVIEQFIKYIEWDFTFTLKAVDPIVLSDTDEMWYDAEARDFYRGSVEDFKREHIDSKKFKKYMLLRSA